MSFTGTGKVFPVATAVLTAIFNQGCVHPAGSTPRAAAGTAEQVVGGTMDRPARYMVGGAITRVEPETRSLTILTPMKVSERIRFDDLTAIDRAGASQSWAAVRPGTAVKIEYEIQEDGGVLARRIALGQSVGLCPCGPDCSCPPSRGCRVIRTAGAPPGS